MYCIWFNITRTRACALHALSCLQPPRSLSSLWMTNTKCESSARLAAPCCACAFVSRSVLSSIFLTAQNMNSTGVPEDAVRSLAQKHRAYRILLLVQDDVQDLRLPSLTRDCRIGRMEMYTNLRKPCTVQAVATRHDDVVVGGHGGDLPY